MSKRVTIQRIDGDLRIQLPEDVSMQEFEDWLNHKVPRNSISFVELPERWTSAEDD